MEDHLFGEAHYDARSGSAYAQYVKFQTRNSMVPGKHYKVPSYFITPDYGFAGPNYEYTNGFGASTVSERDVGACFAQLATYSGSTITLQPVAQQFGGNPAVLQVGQDYHAQFRQANGQIETARIRITEAGTSLGYTATATLIAPTSLSGAYPPYKLYPDGRLRIDQSGKTPNDRAVTVLKKWGATHANGGYGVPKPNPTHHNRNHPQYIWKTIKMNAGAVGQLDPWRKGMYESKYIEGCFLDGAGTGGKSWFWYDTEDFAHALAVNTAATAMLPLAPANDPEGAWGFAGGWDYGDLVMSPGTTYPWLGSYRGGARTGNGINGSDHVWRCPVHFRAVSIRDRNNGIRALVSMKLNLDDGIETPPSIDGPWGTTYYQRADGSIETFANTEVDNWRPDKLTASEARIPLNVAQASAANSNVIYVTSAAGVTTNHWIHMRYSMRPWAGGCVGLAKVTAVNTAVTPHQITLSRRHHRAFDPNDNGEVFNAQGVAALACLIPASLPADWLFALRGRWGDDV
jgi:hypothetical protein